MPSGHQKISSAKKGELEIRGRGVNFPKKRNYDSFFSRLKVPEEEVIAVEGTYEEIIAIDRGSSNQSSPAIGHKSVRNPSISRSPNGSFNEQIVDALFDQIWSDVSIL